MNFYQQKYFQPYRKLTQPLPDRQNDSYKRSSPNRSRQYDDSPNREENFYDQRTFQRTPSRGAMYGRLTTEPIWEHLYNDGIKTKQQILEKHEINKHKIDTECTFQPIIKHNKRYLVHSSSNFFERNNLWNEQKLEKKIKEKQEKVYDDLRECTFKPKINNRNKRMTEVKSKSTLKNDRSQRQFRQYNRNINPYYSPLKKSQQKSPSPRPVRQNVQVPEVLKMIKSQLRRLNF